MEASCIFCRIIAGEVPAGFILETDSVVAIRDVNPQSPVHILVIPKQHVANIAEQVRSDPDGLEAVMKAAVEAAKLSGLDTDGYRLIINTGSNGGQTVDHLHVHVLGGRPLGWPPG